MDDLKGLRVADVMTLDPVTVTPDAPVEAAERLVCALYGVPTELADEVVAHAVARAKAGMTNSA